MRFAILITICTLCCQLPLGISFLCPEVKTPKCTCVDDKAAQKDHGFSYSQQIKTSVECKGFSVTQAFVNEFSQYVQESNQQCVRSRPTPTGPSPIDNDDSSENELSSPSRPQGSNCALNQFILNKTSMEILDLNGTLDRMEIQEIKLHHNYYLTQIEPATFRGSHDTVRVLEMVHAKVPTRDAIKFAGSFVNLEKMKLLLADMDSLDKYTFAYRSGNGVPGFTQLRELDLSGNHLSRVADYSFHMMTHLRILNLNNNNLHSVPAQMLTFNPPPPLLVNVKLHISIADNHLSSELIDPRAFTSFLRPITFDLSGNHLDSLKAKPFKSFLYLDPRNVVNVKKNPFLCNEESNWILPHVLYLNYTIGGKDDDVNPDFVLEAVGDLTFMHKRKLPDYSFYKIRDIVCEDGISLFARK